MLIPVSLAAPAVRLELTVGDLGNLRRSHRRGYGAPSWTRTNVVGLEGRLPSAGRGKLERANGVEPSRASLATMPRTMRARVLGSCRRICTCYLRLIRSVLICMSFAAVDWSEWLDSNQRSRAPEARALVQTEPHSESGQDGRTCTCGFRVPGSAVCC